MSVISIVTKPDGQRDGTVPALADRPRRLELRGDETDGHDLVLLGCVEQPCAGTVTGLLVLELHLAKPGQGVADMSRVVNGEPSPAARIDVGERTVGQAGSLPRIEAGHGADDNNRVPRRPPDFAVAASDQARSIAARLSGC